MKKIDHAPMANKTRWRNATFHVSSHDVRCARNLQRDFHRDGSWELACPPAFISVDHVSRIDLRGVGGKPICPPGMFRCFRGVAACECETASAREFYSAHLRWRRAQQVHISTTPATNMDLSDASVRRNRCRSSECPEVPRNDRSR